MTMPRTFAGRMMLAQSIVVGIGAATLILTAWIVAPPLFHYHLSHLGLVSPALQLHSEEAFAFSFLIAVVAASIVSVTAAGAVSWFLVRRVSRPIEELATAAESVAAGQFDVEVSQAGFSSELEQLSRSFRQMATRLGESDATRSRLLADLAHELRTPLATLEAYIDGLEDDVLEADGEAWSTMRTQVHRLRRLAEDLRESSAAAEHALGLVLAPLDLRDTCAAAIAAAAPRYQAQEVELVLEVSGAGLPVVGDELRLQQVLANLLENALRHTPKGKMVAVHAYADDFDACVDVIDEGEGFPPGHSEQIFERFHRMDRSRATSSTGGSGLGLTIARAIVLDHQGSLLAASEGVGHGARFALRIPLRSED